jgi:hypothetical protein
MKGSCKECTAYSPATKECRRHSPVMVPIPQQGLGGQLSGYAAIGLYPGSPPDGWCLEFEGGAVFVP